MEFYIHDMSIQIISTCGALKDIALDLKLMQDQSRETIKPRRLLKFTETGTRGTQDWDIRAEFLKPCLTEPSLVPDWSCRHVRSLDHFQVGHLKEHFGARLFTVPQ